MARLSSGFVLGVFLQVPPAASARALSSYVLVGRHISQLVLRIQADATDAVTVPRRDAQKCGYLTLRPEADRTASQAVLNCRGAPVAERTTVAF